jgi:AraC-like DNA-binding protein
MTVSTSPLAARPAPAPRAEVRSRAQGPALPGNLPARLRRALHIPQRLRAALAAASEDEQIRTVERLAAVAGCDRRTLWSQWRQAFGRDYPLRLQDFVHWLLLLRALQRKRPSRAWALVADQVGVHPHTLSRLTRQLTGRTLRELAREGHPALLLHFETGVLAPLLDPGGSPDRGNS